MTLIQRRLRETVYDLQSVNDDRSSDEALSDVLHGLQVEGSCYCRTELSAPWGLEFDAWAGISFHFLAAGRCRVTVAGSAYDLSPGDLVVLPHGDAHAVTGAGEVPAEAVLRRPVALAEGPVLELRHGGGGEPALLLCGGARFDEPDQPLVRALPPALLVHAQDGGMDGWVDATLRVMGLEAARRRPGGEIVLTRLCDILVVHAVRNWLAGSPEAREGWVGALRDERIGPALALLHRHPERPWTVADLAAEAHLSRSAFAERFAERVGRAPLAYLTEHRMRLATRALREGQPLTGVAAGAGYGSVAAFARAYKRSTGLSPGSIRRTPAPLRRSG